MISKAYMPFLLLLGFLFMAGFSVQQPVPMHAESTAGNISFQNSNKGIEVSEAPGLQTISLSQNNTGINLAHILLSGEEETSASDEKRIKELPGDYSLSKVINQDKDNSAALTTLIPHSVKNQIIRHLLTVCMLH